MSSGEISAMAALSTFNREVEQAVQRQDGVKLRDLLRMNSTNATKAMEIYVTRGGSLPAPMPEPWGALPDIVEKRFAAAAALNASNWVESCDHLSQALSAYIAVLAADDAWSVPLLHAMCADLRLFAEQADEQLRSEGRKARKLEEAERVLKRAFTTTNNDRRPILEGSKKVGTLGVINQLLKVYFKLNNLRLCANVTRAVTAPGFPDFEKTFSVAHRVTYKYFSGRLHLYADRCETAVDDLTYAFVHTPPEFHNNRRHVLLYLIPAKMLLGSLPSRGMVEKYEMRWFGDIADAIRTGNLRLFDDAVECHEEFFIRKALYLAIEKMRPLVYRSLCKRVARMLDTNKIRMEQIRSSLKACNVDMDIDEVECILANLIYNGYVKGYLSHKVGFLVLSKKNPFPRGTQ